LVEEANRDLAVIGVRIATSLLESIVVL